MSNSEPADNKISMLLKALGGDFSKVKCSQCGDLEFLIPVDVPFDEVFLANYHCDKCDDATKSDLDPNLMADL